MPSDIQICVYFILSVAPISQRNKGIAQVESNHIFPCYLNSENRNASRSTLWTEVFQLTNGRSKWRAKGCHSSTDLWVFLLLVWSQNLENGMIVYYYPIWSIQNLTILKHLLTHLGSICVLFGASSPSIISARCIAACRFLLTCVKDYVEKKRFIVENKYLSYKLWCYTRILNPEKSRNDTREKKYDVFSHVFDVANYIISCCHVTRLSWHSVGLMNERQSPHESQYKVVCGTFLDYRG